jgi:hypothetical protein
MFCPIVVSEWGAQGRNRIKDAAGNLYILNTRNMFEIKASPHSGKLTLLYFDNISDVRDGGNRMLVTGSVAGIKLASDTDYGAEVVTLDYYPDDDTTQSTKSITLVKKNISYCYCYLFDQTNALSWVVYCEDGWNMKRILVNHSWIPLYSKLEE